MHELAVYMHGCVTRACTITCVCVPALYTRARACHFESSRCGGETFLSQPPPAPTVRRFATGLLARNFVSTEHASTSWEWRNAGGEAPVGRGYGRSPQIFCALFWSSDDCESWQFLHRCMVTLEQAHRVLSSDRVPLQNKNKK